MADRKKSKLRLLIALAGNRLGGMVSRLFDDFFKNATLTPTLQRYGCSETVGVALRGESSALGGRQVGPRIQARTAIKTSVLEAHQPVVHMDSRGRSHWLDTVGGLGIWRPLE